MEATTTTQEATKQTKSKHPSTIELTSALGIPTKARNRRVWTREEDEKLRRLVAHWGDQRGKNSHWDQISAQFEGRTNKDCRKRWFHSLDPTLKRGRWTEEEDRILLEAFNKMGSVWNKIAQLIPGRTDDQCSKRYNDVLDPSVRDRLREWTEEEDDTLLQLVETYGTQWRTISTHMKGRTGLTCRNRWRKIVAPVLPKNKDNNNTHSAAASSSSSASMSTTVAQNPDLKRKRSHENTIVSPSLSPNPSTSNTINISDTIDEDTVMTESSSMAPPQNSRISPASSYHPISHSNQQSVHPSPTGNTHIQMQQSLHSQQRPQQHQSMSSPMNGKSQSLSSLMTNSTPQEDFSPHSNPPIPESPSTVALLQQVKVTPLGNQSGSSTGTSPSTVSSTHYTATFNGRDELNVKLQDLQQLIDLAGRSGQQIVIHQHNYIHHHHHHHHYNDQQQHKNDVYYNRSTSSGNLNPQSNGSSSSQSSITHHNHTHHHSHHNSVGSNGSAKSNKPNIPNNNKTTSSAKLSNADVSNLSALFSELEELEVDSHEDHMHFGTYQPIHNVTVKTQPQQTYANKLGDDENYGLEGIPFNPS